MAGIYFLYQFTRVKLVHMFVCIHKMLSLLMLLTFFFQLFIMLVLYSVDAISFAS